MSPEFLDERLVAAQLGLSVSTLQTWRHKHQGPAYHKIGRRVRCSRGDVDAWLNAQRVQTKGAA